MSQYDKFYAYLQELDQSYGHLADLLRQKLSAVEEFDLTTLDELMKQEQVYVLLSKGFDSNIHSHRDKLSLQGATLSEIIEELPAEEKARFQLQYTSLRTTLDAVKGMNDKCQSAIEERLYSLDKSIKALDKTEGSTYKQTGDAKSSSSGQMFTKSI